MKKKIIKKKIKRTEFGKLNLDRDLIKGLQTGALVGFLTTVSQLCVTGFVFNKTTLLFLLGGTVSGMVAHLSRKVGTNSNDEFLKTETGKPIYKALLDTLLSVLNKKIK